jgi:uncharacterized protein
MTQAQHAAPTGRPVIAGLITDTPDGPSLLGTRCATCQEMYFPQVVGCRNPDCTRSALEPAPLPRNGVLYSYTWQGYQPPLPFKVDDWAPYAIAMVDLGGLRILSRIDAPREDLRIGLPVTLALDEMSNDEEGPVHGYVFTAAEKG